MSSLYNGEIIGVCIFANLYNVAFIKPHVSTLCGNRVVVGKNRLGEVPTISAIVSEIFFEFDAAAGFERRVTGK